MGFMKWLRDTFIPKPKRDMFVCLHCHKETKGANWCMNDECQGKPSRGWYYDEDGHVNKPSRIRHGGKYDTKHI